MVKIAITLLNTSYENCLFNLSTKSYVFDIFLTGSILLIYMFCVFQMDKIFNVLKKFRLEKYYKKFIDLGIQEELDFFDSVNDKTLKDMGMSFILKFLFGLLKSVLLISIIWT